MRQTVDVVVNLLARAVGEVQANAQAREKKADLSAPSHDFVKDISRAELTASEVGRQLFYAANNEIVCCQKSKQ